MGFLGISKVACGGEGIIGQERVFGSAGVGRARIAQSSALPPVADEPASPLRDVSQGEACPTVSDFEAEQDRTNIAKTSSLPYESTSRVTSFAADEGSMQHKFDELTTLCTSLQSQQSEMVSRFEAQGLEINSLKAIIKLLEDKDRVVAEHFGDDTPIKRRRLDVGEEAAERVSDDTEFPTGSGSIPTAGPPATRVPTSNDVVPTAGLIFATATVVTPYTRTKGKETMVESETLKKKNVQQQIDAQVIRELEEQLARENQRMFEQIARDAEIERIHAEEELQIMIDGLERRNDTGGDKKNFDPVWMQIHDFIPIGSKEEAKRFKRKGIMFEQESAKKLKTTEEVPEEVKTPDEVPEEKVKEMMQQILLKKEDLYQLWRLVKESLSIRLAASDKEMKLWVELKRLYEPDDEDQLNKMHKAFLLPVREFPLPEEVPTASEESSHCQKKRDAAAHKIALLLKSSSNCQSKSYESYA
nr:hypothetical protein [Tanacetum cinerariifolium]